MYVCNGLTLVWLYVNLCYEEYIMKTFKIIAALMSMIVSLCLVFTIGYYQGDRAREQIKINVAFTMDVCRDKPDFVKCLDFFSQAVNKPFNKTTP